MKFPPVRPELFDFGLEFEHQVNMEMTSPRFPPSLG